MDAVWLIVAIHGGLFAAGFGLAGVLQFQEFENRRRLAHLATALDPTGITALVIAIASMFENWKHVHTGRRFIYAALISLVITVGAMCLRNSVTVVPL
jgi:hypothetical protein